MKTDNKYARLLEYSKGNNYMHTNMLYVDGVSRSIIAINGIRMLAVRDIYNETKVLSRVTDSNDCLKYENGVLVSSKDRILPSFTSIIPTLKTLNESYKKVRLEVPAWIKGISKREKNAYVSFILGLSPVLAISDGSNADYCTVNAHFLKDFIGQEIDVYIKGPRDAVVVMPANESIDNASWFSLVMPVKTGAGAIEYPKV